MCVTVVARLGAKLGETVTLRASRHAQEEWVPPSMLSHGQQYANLRRGSVNFDCPSKAIRAEGAAVRAVRSRSDDFQREAA